MALKIYLDTTPISQSQLEELLFDELREQTDPFISGLGNRAKEHVVITIVKHFIKNLPSDTPTDKELNEIVNSLPNKATKSLNRGYKVFIPYFFSNITVEKKSRAKFTRPNIAKKESDKLIDSVTSKDPISATYGLDMGTSEHTSAEKFHSDANKLNSWDGLLKVLETFKKVGKYFMIVGVFMTAYALKIDFEFYFKALMKLAGDYSFIVTFAVAISVTLLLKSAIAGVLNAHFQKSKVALTIVYLWGALWFGVLGYTHYRFGVIMAQNNEKLMKEEVLADTTSSQNLAVTKSDNEKARVQASFNEATKEVDRYKATLTALRVEDERLALEYNKADTKYQSKKIRKNLVDRQKCHTLREKNTAKIDKYEERLASAKSTKKAYSDTLSIVEDEKIAKVETIEKDIAKEGEDWKIFLWVIMGAIEFLGMAGVIADILILLLLPKNISAELLKLAEGADLMDTANAYFKRMKAYQNHAFEQNLNHELEGIQIAHAGQHKTREVIAEVIAIGHENTYQVLDSFSKRFALENKGNRFE